MTLRAFQCFAAGAHTDMHGRTCVFSQMDLKAIAIGYEPTRRTAPLVLGHPDDDLRAPSYGSVKGLVAEGDSLFCIADVTPNLLELVRAGRYAKVSASFFLPGTTGNPGGANYYLRHVGFLGAAIPAVKGMQPLAFAISLGRYQDEMEAAVAHSSFSANGVNGESRNAQLCRVAKDLCRAIPDMSLISAASRAERAISQ